MTNKNIADWLKEYESKGYSEKQLISFLLKKGYSKKEIDEAISSGNSFNILDKIKYLVTSPNNLFAEVEKEQGIKNALIISLIGLLFYSILGMGVSFFGRVFYFGYWPMSFGLPGLIFISGIAGLFVWVGIMHLFLKLFKAQENYVRTFQVVAYSNVPVYLFAWIPFIGFLSLIYSFVLMIIGFSRIHKISKGMAALAIFTPILLIFGLFIIFIIYLLSTWSW